MPSLFQRLKTWWTKAPVPPAPAPAVAQEDRASVDHPQREESGCSAGAYALSHEQVYEALRQCSDPEIPVNIVDLGLVYDVQVVEGRVDVKMSLTTRGCGMGGYIASEAAERVRALPGVREVNVEVVWDPPWTPDMISPAGRKILGLPLS